MWSRADVCARAVRLTVSLRLTDPACRCLDIAIRLRRYGSNGTLDNGGFVCRRAFQQAAQPEKAKKDAYEDPGFRHQIGKFVFGFANLAEPAIRPQLPVDALDLFTAFATEFRLVKHPVGIRLKTKLIEKINNDRAVRLMDCEEIINDYFDNVKVYVRKRKCNRSPVHGV